MTDTDDQQHPVGSNPTAATEAAAILLDSDVRRNVGIPRVASLLVLLVFLVVIGALFFQVMATFLVPLFLAAVLVVIFQPVHRWFLQRMPDQKRVAAFLTTACVLLSVLLPTVLIGWQATHEAVNLVRHLEGDSEEITISQRVENVWSEFETWWEAKVPGKPIELQELAQGSASFVAEWGAVGLGAVISVIIGMAILTISVYYFLIDGPAMIQALMYMSPMEDKYERQLLDRFVEISRAVVLATLLSAVVQGLLAGIGYYFALPASWPIVLLMALTMLIAMVPFFGAAAVWAPTCLALLLLGGEGDTRPWGAVIGLAIWGACVVSLSDNVIKPWVLHGQSRLHPLLALLSVLGGVAALGPIGILVGPMAVSFLQALLEMLRNELESIGGPLHPTPAGASPTATASSSSAAKRDAEVSKGRAGKRSRRKK